MGQLRIMGPKGDIRLMWDRNNPEEVAQAKKNFDEMRAKRDGRDRPLYHAYAVKKSGKPGEMITEFDPDAEKIILAPQMSGGC